MFCIARRLRLIFLLSILSLSLVMIGCSGRQWATLFKWNTKIYVTVDSDANRTSAVAVDVITPLTDEVDKKLMTMTARQWFTNKEQFSRDYSADNDYIVDHQEYVPGTSPEPITIPFRVKTKSIIIYGEQVASETEQAGEQYGEQQAEQAAGVDSATSTGTDTGSDPSSEVSSPPSINFSF